MAWEYRNGQCQFVADADSQARQPFQTEAQALNARLVSSLLVLRPIQLTIKFVPFIYHRTITSKCYIYQV